jgi:hypothetical protein
MNMKKIVIVSLTAIAAMAIPAAAQAEERVCRGVINAENIDGDIVVPTNASCTLRGTKVDGNVRVARGATLTASGIEVNGSVQAEGHRRVAISANSMINGSIQLNQGGSASILNSRVNADVQLFTNRGSQIVRGNTIGGNLQCKSNSPAPTGGANRVAGNKEDQCAKL